MKSCLIRMMTTAAACIFAGCMFVSCPSSSAEQDKEEENFSLFEFTGDKNYVSPKNVSVSSAENQSTGLASGWWKTTAFYHIWVKSFNDSDGDGCGDIPGITAKLDYIKDTLGCDGIWLSPVFECTYKGKSASENMHGYDVADYYTVNSYFGTEADLTTLIQACHNKGIKIIFDFVPNHTSSGNAWFESSDAAKDGKRSWYLWNSSQLAWNPMGNTSTWHSGTGGYYYGAFGSNMPDLNYRNYEVREEMKNVVRYWLNKGFDGLRIDAPMYLIEDSGVYKNTQETHDWFKELRKDVVDAYASPKFMVGETWISGDRTTLNSYFGTSAAPEFNMVLDFDAGLPCIDSVNHHYDSTVSTIRANPADFTGEAYGTFLGNHDLYAGRFGSTLAGDTARIQETTALSLMRPTVPFIYYGNELGQQITTDGGDLALRGPFDWTAEASQASDAVSTLNLNKALLTLRKTYAETFSDGSVTKLVSSNSASAAYIISGNSDKFLCVYNFSKSASPSLTFTGSSITAGTVSSVLVGDDDTTEAETPLFSESSVTVYKLAPYAYRMYYIGDSTKADLFDSETYTEGETHTDAIIYSKSMYLRGTMNSWGGTAMTVNTTTGEAVWSVTVLLSAGTYEFKFCINDGTPWQTNWGNESGDNISYTSSSSGTYKFIFNETALRWNVQKL